MGGTVAFKQINTDDQNLELIQDNVNDALRDNTTQIQKTTQGGKTVFVTSQVSPPFSGGIFLFDVSLTSAVDNLVSHGLGRRPKLWVVSYQTVNTTVWAVQTTALATSGLTTRDSSDVYLNLWCGTSCVIHLWVN